jgi:hypothetical protein
VSSSTTIHQGKGTRFPAIALPMLWPAPVTIAILSLSLPSRFLLPGKRGGKRQAIKQWMLCDGKMNVLPLEAEGPLPPGALKRSG